MKNTRNKVEAWAKREEIHRWEATIGPYSENSDGTVAINSLHDIAVLSGLIRTHSIREC